MRKALDNTNKQSWIEYEVWESALHHIILCHPSPTNRILDTIKSTKQRKLERWQRILTLNLSFPNFLAQMGSFQRNCNLISPCRNTTSINCYFYLRYVYIVHCRLAKESSNWKAVDKLTWCTNGLGCQFPLEWVHSVQDFQLSFCIQYHLYYRNTGKNVYWKVGGNTEKSHFTNHIESNHLSVDGCTYCEDFFCSCPESVQNW